MFLVKKFYGIIFLLLICKAEEYDEIWPESIVTGILRDVQPHTVAMWTGNMDFATQKLKNHICREFSQSVPTFKFDELIYQQQVGGRDVGSLWNWVSLNIPILHRPTKSLVHVILLENELYLLFVQRFLFQFQVVHASLLKPKILFIIIDEDKFSHLSKVSEDLQNSADYAWKTKITDLTFVYLKRNKKSQPHILFYSKFENKMTVQRLDKNTTLFPYKLTNMQGSEFTVVDSANAITRSAEDQVKYEEFVINNYFWRLQMTPGDYSFVRYFFCKIHNCTAKLTKDTNVPADILYGLFRFHRLGDISGLCYEHSPLVAVIPHHDEKSTSSSHHYVTNSIRLYLILASLTFMLKLLSKIGFLKLGERNWKYLDIFQCMLGSSISIRNLWKQRIFYLILIVLSLYVSSDLIDLTTDIQIDITRKAVESVEDLKHLNVSIYSIFDREYVFGEQANSLDKFEDNYTEDDPYDLIDCLSKLSQKNDRICIVFTESFYIHSALYKHRNARGLRKANFEIASSCKSVYFGFHSPYIEAYDRLTLMALDHGFLRHYSWKEYLNALHMEMDQEDYDIVPNDEFGFYLSAFYVLLLSFTLAFGAFIVEFNMGTIWPIVKIYWDLWMTHRNRRRKVENIPQDALPILLISTKQ